MSGEIKAVIFDFGGTLDTNGIHWAEKYWETYAHFNIGVSKEDFRRAYVYAERKLPEIVTPLFSLRKTYETQLTYQLEYLAINNLVSDLDLSLSKELNEYCYREVLRTSDLSIQILKQLKDKYILGLVSNYYGNVQAVLSELGLAHFFNSIIDSTIVGVRKPDLKIFKIILSELKLQPSEIIVVGDSYTNDITPAKTLGCKTIWLKVSGWNNHNCEENADKTINSILDLPAAIRLLQK